MAEKNAHWTLGAVRRPQVVNLAIAQTFDRETGVNLWKQDQLKYRWLSAPAIQGKYVVVGDSEGYVHWLSLDEGKFAARERLGKKAIEGAPLIVDGVVYVEDVKGRIGAYRARP